MLWLDKKTAAGYHILQTRSCFLWLSVFCFVQ